MMKSILLAVVAIAASLTFSADQADAFGGRGHARRHARRTHYVPVPVVVQRVYAAPVVSYYRAPIYYQPPVSVNVGRYGGYYGSGYYGSSYHNFGHPSHGARVGW